MIRTLLAAILVTIFVSRVLAQDAAKLDRATQDQLKGIVALMSESMQAEDETEVRRQFQRAIVSLGDQAGLPESQDDYRAVTDNARALTAAELATAFDFYIPYIERQKWWRIGLDPATTNHALRKVATVIEGCLAARQVSEAQSEKLLAIVRDAGDFLVWTQQQAETPVLPFPAVRNGKGRPFEVAEQLQDCQTDEALDILERYAAERFRAGKYALGPCAWGEMLAFRRRAGTR